MKAKEVLNLLKITRPTLCKYVREKRIDATLLPNGQYDYNKESVYKFFNKDLVRRDVLYCRVSTNKQKSDLNNQQKTLETFCHNNGIRISDVFSDIGSGIDFNRKEFQRLVDDVAEHKIDRVFITYKDRLSRISFDLFKGLFAKFNCEIVVLNDVDDEKQVEKEIFNEIINLIHCFSMKVYSNRRKEKLKLIERDLKLEISQ